MIERPSQRSVSDLKNIRIDPEDPAVFQLSGGTTGIPKLIPRTHNDYIYNSKIAAAVTGVGAAEDFLDVLPLAHNLPLACPGLARLSFARRQIRAVELDAERGYFRA